MHSQKNWEVLNAIVRLNVLKIPSSHLQCNWQYYMHLKTVKLTNGLPDLMMTEVKVFSAIVVDISFSGINIEHFDTVKYLVY